MAKEPCAELIMNPLRSPSEDLVEAAYRLFEDGVRRWRDLDIAEWLGLSRPRDIRDVIKANLQELERHGSLRSVTANPSEQGGRPGTEYWLNFEQAMVVCTLSRGPRAEDVRYLMAQDILTGGHG